MDLHSLSTSPAKKNRYKLQFSDFAIIIVIIIIIIIIIVVVVVVV